MATQPAPAKPGPMSTRRRFVGYAIYLYCIGVILLEVGSLIKGGISANANGAPHQVQVLQMLALLFASLGFFFSGLFLLVDIKRNPRTK